jgi:hypothetical protein
VSTPTSATRPLPDRYVEGITRYLTEVVGTSNRLDRDRDVVGLGATADHGCQEHPLGELEQGHGMVDEVCLAATEPLGVGKTGHRDRQQ